MKLITQKTALVDCLGIVNKAVSSRSSIQVLSGVLLMAATALVNVAPENPYLANSLQVWRQGHFLNFNGLTRIVSTLWPFAALVYLLLAAGRRETPRPSKSEQ